MKKKLMAILTLIAATATILPATAVKAADTFATYTPGERVNFYTHTGDSVGTESFIVADAGSADRYVKTALFITGYSGSAVYCEAPVDGDCTVIENTTSHKGIKSYIGQELYGLEGHAKDINTAGNLIGLTLDDLKTVYGATSADNGATYTISVDKWGKGTTLFTAFAELNLAGIEGFYTTTVEGDQVWAVKVTGDAEGNPTSIKVEKVALDYNGELLTLPVVYMDKTYDCRYKPVNQEVNKFCYVCGENQDEYKWAEEGKAGAGCTLKKDIKKNDCVKNPETGLTDYMLPVTIVVCAAAVVLTIVTKKDLFRNI